MQLIVRFSSCSVVDLHVPFGHLLLGSQSTSRLKDFGRPLALHMRLSCPSYLPLRLAAQSSLFYLPATIGEAMTAKLSKDHLAFHSRLSPVDGLNSIE